MICSSDYEFNFIHTPKTLRNVDPKSKDSGMLVEKESGSRLPRGVDAEGSHAQADPWEMPELKR